MADLIGLIAAYLIGSLPLGSLMIRSVTGKNPQAFSAHSLGVENLFFFIGAPVAALSFFLDILKAFAALTLFGGQPLAIIGVYLGHLYPVRWPYNEGIPRGRGNGVLLGILLGCLSQGLLPLWLVLVGVAMYAAVLAASQYVTLASLSALVTLTLLSTGQSIPLFFTLLILTAIAIWRHKASIARILDRTEARLGHPPAVHGRDPQIIRAAFMIHPITVDDLWQPRSQRWLKQAMERGIVSEALLRRALLLMRPQVQDEITGIRLRDGREMTVLLIGGPLLPDQIRAYPEVATQMAIRGARLARECGAEAFGLGAFWSTVGEKGLRVQEAVPEIAITNGGAYTAATVKAAVPGLLQSFAAEGGDLRQSAAAVVGANGVVAFGVARMIAGEVGEVILIGRDPERLERSANTLRRKYPKTLFKVGTDIADCLEADLIFTATSDPLPVIYAEHVKPGAWIFDLGRPADVAEDVRQVPGVHIVPGGVVRPPGDIRHHLNIHFGEGLVPACLAETMIMTASKAFERRSLGPATRTADIDFYLRKAEALGFEVVTRDERVARATEQV
jgi:acyl-phosphate glycerol 3-phosphate acyltransferase